MPAVVIAPTLFCAEDFGGTTPTTPMATVSSLQPQKRMDILQQLRDEREARMRRIEMLDREIERLERT